MDELNKYFTRIQTEILEKLIYHLTKNGEFINADYWYLKKLQYYKVFGDEVIEYIAKATRETPKMVEKMMQDIGIDTTKKYKGYISDEQLETSPDLMNDPTIKAILKRAKDSTTNRLIELSASMISPCRQIYLDTVEEMYLKVSTGATSYTQAIIESIEKLSRTGINFLEYAYVKENKDGNKETLIRHYDIPSVVRREINTAVRQTSNELNIELIEETGAEYVKISEHINCRPQHFDWQGLILPKDKWEEITDYGSITGLGGINCKHYVEAYFGEPKPKDKEKKFTKEECEERYNQEQTLRKLERTERKWLYQKDLLDRTNVPDTKEDIEKLENRKDFVKKKIDQYRKAIIKYADNNNLKRDFTREIIK